jgi:hypothetical protein
MRGIAFRVQMASNVTVHQVGKVSCVMSMWMSVLEDQDPVYMGAHVQTQMVVISVTVNLLDSLVFTVKSRLMTVFMNPVRTMAHVWMLWQVSVVFVLLATLGLPVTS